MKILHAVHNFPPEFTGGTEAYLLALAQAQARRGHAVLVVSGSETSGPEVGRETHEGVRVLRLHHDPAVERYSVFLSIPRLAPVYRRILHDERPDVVHVHHWLNLGIPLVQIARDLGVRTALSLHDFTAACPRFFLIRPDGLFCGEHAPVPPARCLDCCGSEYAGSRAAMAAEFEARRAFFAAELAAAGVVLVPSEKAGRYLAGTGILAHPPQLHALPLGALRALRPQPRQSVAGRLRLVFFGNLAPVKGVELLLAAVAGLEPELRDRVDVLLLGRATDAELSRRVDAFAGRVRLRREDVFDAARLERLPAEADAAVFPGLAAETYSLVVDEALCLGLPVIVSDRGAAAERAGAAAVVVKTGDEQALRDAIRGLLLDPARLERLRAQAQGRAWSIDDHAARLDTLYPAMETATSSTDAAPLQTPGANGHVPFDPDHRFLPLRAFAGVPGGRVVVLAPHPDDEVIGAGGALALHAGRGDEVVVVHLTDGGGSAQGAERAEVRRRREAEARAAGAEIGVQTFRSLAFPDGALRPEGAFLSGLAGLLETLRPDVLYLPSPFEHHADHRATYLLAAHALRGSRLDPACVLYEVNEPQPAAYLLDITPVLQRKERALRCFTSQIAAIDVVQKTLDANRARTVNVDLPQVIAAEAYLQTRKGRLLELAQRAEDLRRFVAAAAQDDAAPRAGASKPTAAPGDPLPVSAVISTWNKKDDVRENLLALLRQTRPPREIVVVDNCSRDGTAAMIRAEFPQVKLIEMPHDRKGACETFNIGMQAAAQPFIAIMDDDVVAPPEWLERLYERMQREPETTAMVSSQVIEPGMPEEFLRAADANRERYMATFRGCGTLARAHVLKAAGYYDEVFFIYGNERDLSSRVLNLGYRILQYPQAEIFHKTPFGMKAGRRSLYYHVRNFWLYSFKYCTVRQILRAAWVLGLKGLGLKKDRGYSHDATGTIGIDRSVKETPGGVWIAIKASLAALALLPHCLRHRSVCRAPDFEPPVR